MRTWFAALIEDREGVTAIEYALIASLVVLVIVASVTALGQNVQNLLWGPISSAVSGAAP